MRHLVKLQIRSAPDRSARSEGLQWLPRNPILLWATAHTGRGDAGASSIFLTLLLWVGEVFIMTPELTWSRVDCGWELRRIRQNWVEDSVYKWNFKCRRKAQAQKESRCYLVVGRGMGVACLVPSKDLQLSMSLASFLRPICHLSCLEMKWVGNTRSIYQPADYNKGESGVREGNVSGLPANCCVNRCLS